MQRPDARYEASSYTIARDWGRVAVAVAKRTGLNVVYKTSPDADVAVENEPVALSEFRSNPESSLVGDLNSSVFARPRQFRVQFVGAARGREPLLLKEVWINAADVSAAVVAAASLTLPPKTNGLHIRTGRSAHLMPAASEVGLSPKLLTDNRGRVELRAALKMRQQGTSRSLTRMTEGGDIAK